MFGSGRQSTAGDGGSHGFGWVCLALSCFTLAAAAQQQTTQAGRLIPYTRSEYEAEGLSRTHSHAELTQVATLTAYVCTRASTPEHILERVRSLAPAVRATSVGAEVLVIVLSRQLKSDSRLARP